MSAPSFSLTGARITHIVSGDNVIERVLAEDVDRCPWSWHESRCWRSFGHGSPHLLEVEEPWTRKPRKRVGFQPMRDGIDYDSSEQ